MSAEELQSMGGGESSGAASPLTARSLRLERVAQALAHSQEELRRCVHAGSIILTVDAGCRSFLTKLFFLVIVSE